MIFFSPIPYKGCSRGPKLGTYSDWGLSSVFVINKHLSHHDFFSLGYDIWCLLGPVPDTTWNLDTATRELRPPEPPASTMPMSTVVTPDRYTGQGSVEVGSLPLNCHNLGTSTMCEMTPPRHSQSTQPAHCDTAHMFITSAISDTTHDLDRENLYTRLHTQARDRNRVLVEPPRDGTQSCLYHIVPVFVGQNMTQVRSDLRAWYLQPVNQARLCDMLPTNLQSPAEWSRRSRSALNPSNLVDECDVYSLAFLFDGPFRFCPLRRVSR